jgi:hypothetical protein
MMGKTSRSTRIAMVLLLGYWIALFVGTHSPSLPVGVGRGWDKLAHFAGYAGLAFLLAWTLAARGRRSFAAGLSVLAVAAAYGVLDELLQAPVPGRSPDLWDWTADVGGAAAGLAAFHALHAAAALFRQDASAHSPGGQSSEPLNSEL